VGVKQLSDLLQINNCKCSDTPSNELRN